MTRKKVLYISTTKQHHEMIQVLAQELDISILQSSPSNFKQATLSGHEFELIIINKNEFINRHFLSMVDEYCMQNDLIPLLFVVGINRINELNLPVSLRSDFVVSDASQAEYVMRVARLLWPSEEPLPADIISVDSLTMNLATYQVTVDGKPVDLTHMEHALLAFMVMHPGRAYTRETLLHRVWGFEYCGGTRTVDVHVRRVRSKLGPQIASYIETVRGVGYMFKH